MHAGCVEVAAVQATVHDITVGCGSAVAAEAGGSGLSLLLEPKAHVGLIPSSRAKGDAADAVHAFLAFALGASLRLCVRCWGGCGGRGGGGRVWE